MQEDFKFVTKMLCTRQRLKETVSLTIHLDELLRAVKEKHVYGRPFITLNTKRLTLPLHRLQLKIRFTSGNQEIGEAVLLCGNFDSEKKLR